MRFDNVCTLPFESFCMCTTLLVLCLMNSLLSKHAQIPYYMNVKHSWNLKHASTIHDVVYYLIHPCYSCCFVSYPYCTHGHIDGMMWETYWIF